MLNGLLLGLGYPSNKTMIVIIGSKFTENKWSTFNIELMEEQSNMVGLEELSLNGAQRDNESQCCGSTFADLTQGK